VKLNTVRLLVTDFAAAFAFWRDVMRLPVAFGSDTPGAPAGYAYFTAGDVGLEVMSRAAFAAALGAAMPTPLPAPSPADRETVLVLQVDDVDATYAELVAHGAKPVTPPRDRAAWGARTAHVADPEGLLIELYSHL
jgi:catechol 2,3-dioxygenase-like lactoylglutathione lyase family enzyme